MNININYVYNFEPKVKQQIEEAIEWLEMVLKSDEFKWKAKEYEEVEGFLEKVDGFTVNFDRLYPEGGTNKKYGALYNSKTSTIKFNVLIGTTYPKRKLAALFAHEIGHQWYDHEEFDVESFLGFLQYKVKNMEGKSNLYYKILLWLSTLFNK